MALLSFFVEAILSHSLFTHFYGAFTSQSIVTHSYVNLPLDSMCLNRPSKASTIHFYVCSLIKYLCSFSNCASNPYLWHFLGLSRCLNIQNVRATALFCFFASIHLLVWEVGTKPKSDLFIINWK